GCTNGRVYVWEGRQTEPAQMLHGQDVHFVVFAPDGKTLASASRKGLVKIRDAQTGRKRGTLKGQGKFLHGIACSPDSQSLATASGDGTVRIWDLVSGRLRRAFDWGIGEIHSVAFSPDGMRAAAGGSPDIMIWDID